VGRHERLEGLVFEGYDPHFGETDHRGYRQCWWAMTVSDNPTFLEVAPSTPRAAAS
jgi:hypothetical protein